MGYAGGETPNPTYEEVCSGLTGHAEAVLVVFEPARLPYAALLRCFFESHDPTQGMGQGNDIGTQYRSVIFAYDEAQRQAAVAAREAYQAVLSRAVMARSRPRSATHRRSTTPSPITSNISPRTPEVTAA